MCVGEGGTGVLTELPSDSNHCSLNGQAILQTMVLASNSEDTDFLQDFILFHKKRTRQRLKLGHDPLALSLSLPSRQKYHICGRLPYYLAVQTYFADSAIPQIRLATKLI